MPSHIPKGFSIIVSAICLGAIALQNLPAPHANVVDGTTVTLIGIGLLPWLLQYVDTFKAGPSGIEIKRLAERVEETAEIARVTQVVATTGVGATALRTAVRTAPVERHKTRGLETELEDSPPSAAVQSVARGRKLSASVTPLAWNPDLFEIVFTVSSLPASPPLAERALVKFHLQSTFTQPDVTVEASGGVATLTRYALGAFLVSAEIPAEGVTLALDLAQVPDAPARFKAH
jgi:hypothetical protein